MLPVVMCEAVTRVSVVAVFKLLTDKLRHLSESMVSVFLFVCGREPHQTLHN